MLAKSSACPVTTPGRETAGHGCKRAFLGGERRGPFGQFVGNGDLLVGGDRDEARRKIGVAGRQRVLDVARNQRRIVGERVLQMDICQCGGIVLGEQQFAGEPGMRIQREPQAREDRNQCQSRFCAEPHEKPKSILSKNLRLRMRRATVAT